MIFKILNKKKFQKIMMIRRSNQKVKLTIIIHIIKGAIDIIMIEIMKEIDILPFNHQDTHRYHLFQTLKMIHLIFLSVNQTVV
jgi:hypothetical protein